MKITSFVVGLALVATVASAAELTLFEHDDFHGRRFSINGGAENLMTAGFNDRASSAVVRGGPWQVCEDVEFQGRCVTLQPGEYPSLARLGINDRISSARELGGRGERQSSRRWEERQQSSPHNQGPRWGADRAPYDSDAAEDYRPDYRPDYRR